MVKIGVLLPGQGAQAVGMGKAFYDRFAEARELYQTANRLLGYDLTAMCFEGPAEALTKTETCQPALFVTSVAAYAGMMSGSPGLRPVVAAGLSLGELSALAVAESLGFADGVYVVQARAAAMAECAARNPGAMLAVVGLQQDVIDEACRGLDGVVAANYNAADQVVLSGTVEGITRAEAVMKERGAKRVIRLEVSGAFHSPLMQPAADAVRQAIKKVTFKAPKFPVVSNVTAAPVDDPAKIPEILVKQIVSPVRWDASVRWMAGQGAAAFVELPPARVLTALLRRIDPALKTTAVDSPDDLQQLPQQVPS